LGFIHLGLDVEANSGNPEACKILGAVEFLGKTIRLLEDTTDIVMEQSELATYLNEALRQKAAA
jgi:hypothetical protein